MLLDGGSSIPVIFLISLKLPSAISYHHAFPSCYSIVPDADHLNAKSREEFVLRFVVMVEVFAWDQNAIDAFGGMSIEVKSLTVAQTAAFHNYHKPCKICIANDCWMSWHGLRIWTRNGNHLKQSFSNVFVWPRVTRQSSPLLRRIWLRRIWTSTQPAWLQSCFHVVLYLARR